MTQEEIAAKAANLKSFRSCALWPDGTFYSSDDTQITRDEHRTESAAEAVCKRLESDGFGGDGKVFPLKTWTEPIPFEEQFPEEAQALMDLCTERQAKKKRTGKPNKPLFLDAPDPITVAPKTGRNEPCPCGSGKKFKKCCG